MKILLIGQGGREAALGWRIAQGATLYVLMKHNNPSLSRYAVESGGAVRLGNPNDPAQVVKTAQEFGVDLVFVSADDPLANGVIDAVVEAGIKAVGPSKAGAEIEWSKTFSRALLARIAPEANPQHFVATTKAEVESIFARFTPHQQLAIKPVGLTGGKGVKVMGPHLNTLADAKDYALDILASGIGGGAAVIIEEKMVGAEFTIQAFTDGKTLVVPNGTCDYPYRNDNDTGPKTGGMGTYSVRTKNLPYLSVEAFEKGAALMQKTLDALRAEGRHYTGAFYGSFFALPDGQVKVVEFNARYGDPEGMNIMMLLNAAFVEALVATEQQALTPTHMQQLDACSALVCLVAPDYALPSAATAQALEFELDVPALEAMGCHVFFASAEHVAGNTYRTVGASRTVSIGAVHEDLETARALVYEGIAKHVKGALQYRRDVASSANIEAARQRLAA